MGGGPVSIDNSKSTVFWTSVYNRCFKASSTTSNYAGATIVPVNKWVGGGQWNGELYLDIRASWYWDGCGPYGADWKNQGNFEILLYK